MFSVWRYCSFPVTTVLYLLLFYNGLGVVIKIWTFYNNVSTNIPLTLRLYDATVTNSAKSETNGPHITAQYTLSTKFFPKSHFGTQKQNIRNC